MLPMPDACSLYCHRLETADIVGGRGKSKKSPLFSAFSDSVTHGSQGAELPCFDVA